MSGYVAGGWGATALIIVLYAWRTLHRGRVLGGSGSRSGTGSRSGLGRGKPWR